MNCKGSSSADRFLLTWRDGDLERGRLQATVMNAAESVGVAARAMRLAVEYAKERKQFGRPIGAYQAVSHRCAQMLLETEGARSASYYAAWCGDAEPETLPLAACMAKAYASDAGWRVCTSSLQVHGGIGFTWEHDLHFFVKRAKVDGILYGSAREHRDAVAELSIELFGSFAGPVDGRRRFGLDPRRDAQQDVDVACQARQQLQLREAVDHDPPHAQLHSELDLRPGLVVAVEQHPLHREAGETGGRQLPLARNGEVQPLGRGDLQHPDDAQRLGRVGHGHVRAERRPVLAHPADQFGLVEDIQRRPVRGGEVSARHAADGGQPGAVEPRRAREEVGDHGPHMRSGALTPSRPSALTTVWRVATQSQ
jgi:hypothetical protein